MEVDEESSSSSSMKRTRAPLSDSEDNVLPSLVNDNQKRRRLEAAGQENQSPKPSSSGRLVELETKPDTPIVPSVRSRVQQLSQRRDGGPPLAQRCLSDPGADSPAVFREKCLREHLLGEHEFHQRMERFKVPVFQASPALAKSPVFPSPRSCSNFVSGIQQKLQCTTIPSLQQASRMREERRQELSKLQPISENAWLKRSSSDSSLTQADNDAEMKDGSFTEVLTSGAEKRSSDGTGTHCETPTASIELENSNAGLLQKKQKEGDTLQGEGVLEETEHKGLFIDEGSQQSHSQTILKLSFSEDHSFSNTPFDGHPDELSIGDEESLLESTLPEKSNMEETGEVSNITEQGSSDMFTCKDAEETCSYSYSEEEIEPSTDEELRMWQYPQGKVCKEKQSVAEEQQRDLCVTETEGLDSTIGGKGDNVADGSALSDSQSKEGYFAFGAEASCSFEVQEDKNHRPKMKELESESCLGDLVKDHCTLNRDQGNVESSDGIQTGDMGICTKQTDQDDIDSYTCDDAICQQANESVMINIIEDISGESDKNVEPTLMEVQTQDKELERNIKDNPKVDTQAKSSHVGGSDGDQCSREGQVSSDHPLEETEQDVVNTRQEVVETVTKKRAVREESSKKVTFILEPELINHPILNESNISMEETAETHMSELSTNDEADTGQIIDQMFEEVLEYAEKIEDERVVNDEEHDSGIGACCGGRDKMVMEVEKRKSEEDENLKEDECDEGKLEDNEEELLSFPPSGILSPLSKSVEAVVTPLRLTVNQESNPPSLLLTPEETSTPPAEPAPLYSVDAYRTQRQTKNPTIQSVTPGVQRRVPQKSQPQPSVNTKEKIAALNEEAGKLQNVINQTLQALSCCTDEDHGRGSLEEAEAEKLLLVSCEKRSALLSEVTQLREQKNPESEETSGNDTEYVSQLPCRGTVSITNIQLPLKVEFVCSSHNRPGRPSHYFFVLIRYGHCNIVATPLATAADAQNGDTISFPTSVTLKDIRSSFEIDVEVYSLSHTSSSNCTMDRTTTKSRATPKKLLNTITRSNNSLTSAGSRVLNTRRSSNFCLVGSHKITLASLGHSRFPLDKMKLEGKIKRLLGDEFQEKVPFLSPLEGHIYLQLDSKGHSNVQHQGFLTMFELISGYGVWNRRYLVLEGCTMYYWNHPNDKETKKAEGSISLSTSSYQSVRPVKRDSCARPFTFELVSNVLQQQDDSLSALAKCWFSADTKQERLDWMEKLGQALLDFHTWSRTSATKAESRHSDASSGGSLRESIL